MRSVTDQEKRLLARKWAAGWRPKSNRIFGCSICRKSCNGFGNRAAPVNDGECCDYCNGSVVLPARFDFAYKQMGGA
jgi:hypothetical protein